MGTPLTVTCRQLSLPAPPPAITIPHFGILAKAHEALGQIPDPFDMLCKFQDQMAVALAPVRRYLEMVEAFLVIKQCMSVIPDAITSLDPSTIWDCMKNLIKAFARLLSWMPPFVYVRTGLDIASYTIDLVDGIFEFLDKLDTKITKWIEIHELALVREDTALVRFVGCGISQVRADMMLILKYVKFIEPVNDTMMDMFIRLINSQGLKDAYDKYKEASEYYDKVETALEGGAASLPALAGFTGSDPGDTHGIVPVPKMTNLWENMNRSRNAAVQIYNILAPFAGYDSDKQTRSSPSFDNF